MRMEKFEYIEETIKYDSGNMMVSKDGVTKTFSTQEALNDLGKEGWELVSVIKDRGTTIGYFKRKI